MHTLFALRDGITLPTSPRRRGRFWRALGTIALLLSSPSGASALDIVLSNGGNAAPGTLQREAFEKAADFLESAFTDPITVRIAVVFGAIPGPLSIRGRAQFDLVPTYYQPVLQIPESAFAFGPNLIADATSAPDASTVANLQPGIALDFVVNTSTAVEFDGNPTETGTSDLFLNDGGGNNLIVITTPALARAVGVTRDATGAALPVGEIDATITLNASLTEIGGFPAWDFDPYDGVGFFSVDFVGVAIHEMLHALGFHSGVDAAENLALGDPLGLLVPACETSFDGIGFIVCPHVSILDLFRFSEVSLGLDPAPPFPCPDCGPGVLDVSAGADAFFSIDGGATEIAPFSSGVTLGDGFPGEHWTPSAGPYFGVMQGSSDRGVAQVVTINDMLAMDVIGWDVTAPEPSGVLPVALLWLAGLGAGSGRRRLRSSSSAPNS